MNGGGGLTHPPGGSGHTLVTDVAFQLTPLSEYFTRHSYEWSNMCQALGEETRITKDKATCDNLRLSMNSSL